MTAARRLAAFATGLDLAAVPPAVVAAAKLHLLDAIGVGLAAASVPLSRPWTGAARTLGGDGPATVFGSAQGAAPTSAALVNGAFVHSLEYDDTHTGSVVHGSAVAAGAALATAEAGGASGASLLAGYLAAWEATIRLGLAAPGAYQAAGVQITAAGGAIGAALAAARVAGLDADTATAAVGIAGSEASGLMAFLADGSTVKALHPGWAAHTGIAATTLARSGMTGPASVIEGRFGFLATFARDPDAAGRLDRLLDDLGTVWHLPDAAFKLYPCCHYIHPFLEALEALLGDGLAAGDVAGITCTVPPPEAPLICEPWERRQAPASGYDGKWGLAYCLAARLVDGRVDVDTFVSEPDPRIVAVARRVDWRPMAETRFPARFEAEVEARLADGTRRSARIDDVRGTPGRPVPAEVVIAKFDANARRTLAPGAADRVREAVLALDGAASPAALTAALRAVSPSGGGGR